MFHKSHIWHVGTFSDCPCIEQKSAPCRADATLECNALQSYAASTLQAAYDRIYSVDAQNVITLLASTINYIARNHSIVGSKCSFWKLCWAKIRSWWWTLKTSVDVNDNDDEITMASLAHIFCQLSVQRMLTWRNDDEQPGDCPRSHSDQFMEHILHCSAN